MSSETNPSEALLSQRWSAYVEAVSTGDKARRACVLSVRAAHATHCLLAVVGGTGGRIAGHARLRSRLRAAAADLGAGRLRPRTRPQLHAAAPHRAAARRRRGDRLRSGPHRFRRAPGLPTACLAAHRASWRGAHACPRPALLARPAEATPTGAAHMRHIAGMCLLVCPRFRVCGGTCAG